MAMLNERLSHFNLTGQQLNDLREAGKIAIPELDRVLDNFYQRAANTPESAAFFASPDMIEHARAKQKEHWSRLLSGQFDATYEAAVETIGRTHARINLPLDQYMSAYANASSDLMAILLKKLNTGLFKRNARMADIASAMSRAFALDIEGVTSATVRIWNEEQEIAFGHLTDAITALSDGNLAHRIPAPADSDFPLRYDTIRRSMNDAVGHLSTMLEQTSGAMGELISVVSQVMTSSDQLSQRTNSQAASLEETAAAMEELVQSVKMSTENIASINTVAGKARERVLDSVSVVKQSQDAMHRIKDASDKIRQITGLIDDIAFQTNLLALNAGVEAARAGEAGRGFAVVASEVRNLAGNSSSAAKEIKDLIAASASEVQEGVKLVASASETLDHTSQNFEELSSLASEIATASNEQSNALVEVNASVTQLDGITQNNANMVEETNHAMGHLHNTAERIQSQLARFGASGESDLSLPEGNPTPLSPSQTGFTPVRADWDMEALSA